MHWIKKDAPPEVVEAIRRIEESADGCFHSLALLTVHSNIAVRALLVGGIRMIERAIAERGDNTLDLTMALLNVSRLVPIAMKWAIKHGSPASALATRHWTASLAIKVDEALDVAIQYSKFESCLPMWHKDRYLAELLSPNLVRFTAPGTTRNHQVSAYQKGIRPKAGPFKGQRTPKAEQTSAVQALFEQVLHSSRKTGTLRFEYRDPWTLWLELLPEYQARVTGIARRSDTLLLGDYTLREFNQFYAAFLAICAAHEFLCFSWERTHSVYPLDSAVMVRSRQGWTDILSTLSGIPPEKCKIMISDLTFDFARSLDLHIHPFIPLDSAKLKLAVAPHFPLHSRPDENILRVCSILRPDIFDATSLQKEPESLVELQKQCPHRALQGRVPVPAPNPDIDLIIADEESSTVVVAELKWLRKTLRHLVVNRANAGVLTEKAVARSHHGVLNVGKSNIRHNSYDIASGAGERVPHPPARVLRAIQARLLA